MALDIGALFGGLIITEQIFSIPGMGRMFFTRSSTVTPRCWPRGSSSRRFMMFFNLIADLLYGFARSPGHGCHFD